MYCISINHKKASSEIREAFTFDDGERLAFLNKTKEIAKGCVLLLTCNRSELYFTGDLGTFERLEQLLGEFKNITVNKIRKYSMNYGEAEAVKHLLKVVCGMDSMVLGEVEIIRQVKEAYLYSKAAGFTDSQINIVFQGALATAKTAATNGEATRLPVSVGTLCAREAVRFCKRVEETKHRPARVLVVGISGRTGGIVAADIHDMDGTIEIIGTLRNHPLKEGTMTEARFSGRGFPCTKVKALDEETGFCGQPGVSYRNYVDRYRLAAKADVIISATKSPHYIFIKDELMENPGERLFLDLAMPRDIDPEIGSISGCELKNLDYFATLAGNNNLAREKSIKQLQPFVDEEVRAIRNEVLYSEFNKKHADIIEAMKQAGRAEFIYRLKEELDTESFAKVLESLVLENDRG